MDEDKEDDITPPRLGPDKVHPIEANISELTSLDEVLALLEKRRVSLPQRGGLEEEDR